MHAMLPCETKQDVSDEMTVIRENYGVTFHKQGILDNAHSVWHQTFVVPLNYSTVPKLDLYCDHLDAVPNNRTLTLQDFFPSLKVYNQRHQRLLKEIRESEQNIYQLLTKQEQHRKRRAILGFVGRFAKSLFGVSTEEDTSILAKQINHIQSLTAKNYDHLISVSDALQSYILKADKREQLLQTAATLNQEAIQLTRTLVNKTIISSKIEIANWINLIHTYGTQYVDTLVDIRSHFHQTEAAVQTAKDYFKDIYHIILCLHMNFKLLCRKLLKNYHDLDHSN